MAYIGIQASALSGKTTFAYGLPQEIRASDNSKFPVLIDFSNQKNPSEAQVVEVVANALWPILHQLTSQFDVTSVASWDMPENTEDLQRQLVLLSQSSVDRWKIVFIVDGIDQLSIKSSEYVQDIFRGLHNEGKSPKNRINDRYGLIIFYQFLSTIEGKSPLSADLTELHLNDASLDQVVGFITDAAASQAGILPDEVGKYIHGYTGGHVAVMQAILSFINPSLLKKTTLQTIKECIGEFLLSRTYVGERLLRFDAPINHAVANCIDGILRTRDIPCNIHIEGMAELLDAGVLQRDVNNIAKFRSPAIKQLYLLALRGVHITCRPNIPDDEMLLAIPEIIDIALNDKVFANVLGIIMKQKPYWSNIERASLEREIAKILRKQYEIHYNSLTLLHRAALQDDPETIVSNSYALVAHHYAKRIIIE